MARSRIVKNVVLDYPKTNERIHSAGYSFRIGANVGGLVEVSVDGGPWQPCRPSVGYWWFDWRCAEPGKHTVVARIRPEDGKEEKTAVRRFWVGNGTTQAPTKPRKAPAKASRKKKAPKPKKRKTSVVDIVTRQPL